MRIFILGNSHAMTIARAFPGQAFNTTINENSAGETRHFHSCTDNCLDEYHDPSNDIVEHIFDPLLHGPIDIGHKTVQYEKQEITFIWRIPSGIHKLSKEVLDLMLDPFKDQLGSDTIIIPCWGDHDLKRNLVKYDNAREEVSAYMDKVIDYFRPFQSHIFFMNPVPFTDDPVFLESEKYKAVFGPRYPLEQTQEQYLKFVDALAELSMEKWLKKPFRIHENIIEGMFTNGVSTADGCHLNEEYSLKLIQYIVNRLKIDMHNLYLT